MDPILRHLLLIRSVVIGGQMVALAVMDRAFGVSVPWPRVSAVLLLLAGFTAVSAWRLRGGGRRAGETHYLLQSIVDILALSALVYVTGGAFNPFTSLFLLPIVFAAAAMRLASVAGITLLAIGLYSGLMLQAGTPTHAHMSHGRFDLHVWGMWYGFILSALVVVLFVARLSRQLRARDRELAALREEALGAERMAALGALAAGTAHELGTPLATIAVIAGELDLEIENMPARAEIERLRQQVARCREILQRMSAHAGNVQADGGGARDIATYLDELVSDWRQRRPEVQVSFAREGEQPVPTIVGDRAITQAIVNVLDNAADAAARHIDIAGHWTARELALDIRDDGDGIPPGVGERLGREAVSTKPDGLGIGLLLTRAILERLGGAFELRAGRERGTHARIVLPLTPLDARRA